MNESSIRKEGFLLYVGYYESVKDLPDHELGQLLRLIFEYKKNPENPVGFSTSQAVMMAFNFIKNQFRLDDIKYQKIVERNQRNGKKGGRPRETKDNDKKPTGFSGIPKNPVEAKKPDKEKDKVKEKEKVKDKNIYIKDEIKSYKTVTTFLKNKKLIIELTKEKYPLKDVNKAFEDFEGYITSRTTKYRDFKLAFFNWVREDRFQKYNLTANKIHSQEKSIEQNEVVRKSAEQSYFIFRAGFLNKRLGKDNWKINEIIKDVDLMKEIMEKFKRLYPKQYVVLNSK